MSLLVGAHRKYLAGIPRLHGADPAVMDVPPVRPHALAILGPGSACPKGVWESSWYIRNRQGCKYTSNTYFVALS